MALAFGKDESHPMVDALMRTRIPRWRELNRAIDERDDMLDFAMKLFHRDRDAAVANYFQNALEQYQLVRHIAGWRGGRPRRMLDFASGYGRLTRLLVHEQLAEQVTVADILEGGMAFQAEQFGVKALLSRTDPNEFRTPERYDLIFVASLFTHLPPATFTAWLRRLADLLEPDGLLIFSVHDEGLTPDKPVVDGIRFESHSESRVLDVEDYGSTWVTESYVLGQVALLGGRGQTPERGGQTPKNEGQTPQVRSFEQRGQTPRSVNSEGRGQTRLQNGGQTPEGANSESGGQTPQSGGQTPSEGWACVRLPRALADWQDVYVISPQAIPDAPPRRQPKGFLEKPELLADGVRLSGWATTIEGPPDRVEVRIEDELVASTREFSSRADVAAHFGRESAARSGWECLLPHAAIRSFRFQILTISAFSADGHELILFLGTLESLFGTVATERNRVLESKVARSEQALSDLRYRLAVTEQEGLTLRHTLDAMRQSKFWRARERWFALKRAAGWTDER